MRHESHEFHESHNPLHNLTRPFFHTLRPADIGNGLQGRAARLHHPLRIHVPAGGPPPLASIARAIIHNRELHPTVRLTISDFHNGGGAEAPSKIDHLGSSDIGR